MLEIAAEMCVSALKKGLKRPSCKSVCVCVCVWPPGAPDTVKHVVFGPRPRILVFHGSRGARDPRILRCLGRPGAQNPRILPCLGRPGAQNPHILRCPGVRAPETLVFYDVWGAREPRILIFYRVCERFRPIFDGRSRGSWGGPHDSQKVLIFRQRACLQSTTFWRPGKVCFYA